jgi:four helix bundle protein
MNTFKELEAWKSCRILRIDIWSLVKKLPTEEKYRLTDQLIRSSRSATNQIAEGFGRFHYLENVHFCRISRGSLNEIIDHISVALDSGYITIEEHDKLENQAVNSIRILNGYIRYLLKAKNGT